MLMPSLSHKRANSFLFSYISDKIPLLSKEKLPVVGIGKHLCGVATGTLTY